MYFQLLVSKNGSSSNFVENILIILANLPPGLRSSIVKSRLSEFVSFDNLQRDQIIEDILANYKKIDREKLLHLVDSWINSLIEMKSQDILIILNSYVLKFYSNSSLLKDIDKDFLFSIINLLNNLPQNKKSQLLDCFFEVIFNTPNPKYLVKLLPIYMEKIYE